MEPVRKILRRMIRQGYLLSDTTERWTKSSRIKTIGVVSANERRPD